MWHDHATILGKGFFLVTLHALYDKAVFLNEKECEDIAKQKIDGIQHKVEEPYIHMITAGSSLEDEAALILDRVECLSEMKNPVKTSTGIMVTDIVHFLRRCPCTAI